MSFLANIFKIKTPLMVIIPAVIVAGIGYYFVSNARDEIAQLNDALDFEKMRQTQSKDRIRIISELSGKIVILNEEINTTSKRLASIEILDDATVQFELDNSYNCILNAMAKDTEFICE